MLMPSMIHVTLMPRSTLVYEVPSSGRIAQSILLRALSSSSRELAGEVRRRNPKPYSVSRITTNRRRIRGYLAVVPPDEYVRVTLKLLNDDLLDPLLEGLEKDNISINGVPVEITDISIFRRSYWDLLAEAPIARGLTLRLITPALGIDDGFPPPAPIVLRRAFEAWNSFSTIKLPEIILERLFLAEPVIPTLLQSDSVKIPFTGRRVTLIGFRGEISYQLWRFWAQEGVVIAALAKLAEFSGVGAKTSLGFGVTKVKFWRKSRQVIGNVFRKAR